MSRCAVLNGTTTYGLGATTATSLSTRGFHVVGQAGDAPTQNYTSTVIEYAGAAELPAAQTLAALFSNVTLKPDSQLKNSTLHLILGSTFTPLKAAQLDAPRFRAWLALMAESPGTSISVAIAAHSKLRPPAPDLNCQAPDLTSQ